MTNSSAPRAFAIPRQLSLTAQAAGAIRGAVAAKTWQEFLPSERRLSDMFQVSRPTIRTAVQQLAKEGLIEIHHGRAHRILTSALPSLASPGRLVVLVSHRSFERMTLSGYQAISDLRVHLTENGFTTDTLVCLAQSASGQRSKLEAYLKRNSIFCCILLSLNKELQEWFAARPLPSLVLGSCHPAVTLPSVDVDYRSVCRHAVGLFRSKGHRRIAFIVPNTNMAGDLASEEGFREGLAQNASGTEIEGQVVRHQGTDTHLTAKLDALFASPQPPTALLVAKPQDVLVVVFYLLKHGIKVPAAVSLIARDHDHLFENVVSHYRVPSGTFAHRLLRLILKLTHESPLSTEPNYIFPQYIAADTVKPLAG